MKRNLNHLHFILIVLVPAVLSEIWIEQRRDGSEIPTALKYNGSVTRISPFLAERSLVDSLLESRQLTCDNSGWQVCASEPGCCPSASLCCPSTPYCKNETSDSCCPYSGVCPSGWECADLCQCIEAGGQCCEDGNYCQKGNICVFSSYYGYGCCTDLSCTAYISDGVTVPLTTDAPTQVATTPPPEPTITVDTYYYFTITWSYYYYYYFTFFEVVTTSTLTSSYTTEYTTVSVYAANSAAASASFHTISSNFVPSTPAAATTALAPQTALPTDAAPTASATLFPSLSIPALPSNTFASSLQAGGDSGPTGAGSASRAHKATVPESWTMIVLALLAITPGIAMVWL